MRSHRKNTVLISSIFTGTKSRGQQECFLMKDSLQHNSRHPRPASPGSKRGLRLSLGRFFRHPWVARPLRCVGIVLGIFWASPLSLVGLAIALPVFVWRGHAQFIHGRNFALLVRGPLADFLLGHHPFGAMAAMALGHIVISENQGLSARVLTHELEHVRQAERWGVVFPFAYLVSSAWAALCGRDPYWHNHFEIAARKAEKHA